MVVTLSMVIHASCTAAKKGNKAAEAPPLHSGRSREGLVLLHCVIAGRGRQARNPQLQARPPAGMEGGPWRCRYARQH